MKNGIVVFMLVLVCAAHAQDYQAKGVSINIVPVANNYHTYGYIDGKRLDSIDAVYADFSLSTQNRVDFDYGQLVSRVKDYALTDAKGTPMQFPAHSYSFMLNFFYFNGWDFVQAYGDTSSRTYILKKRGTGDNR